MENYTKEDAERDRQECQAEMNATEALDKDKRKRSLSFVKKRVSASWYRSVLEFVDDGEYQHDFSIVDKPVGARQKERLRFSHVYIDQHGPGICGDDYYGQICIPIRGGLYLSYHYSC